MPRWQLQEMSIKAYREHATSKQAVPTRYGGERFVWEDPIRLKGMLMTKDDIEFEEARKHLETVCHDTTLRGQR